MDRSVTLFNLDSNSVRVLVLLRAAEGLGKHEIRLGRYPMCYPRIATSPECRRDLPFLGQRANDYKSVLALIWPMSVFGGKADVLAAWPESPLLAKSSHCDAVGWEAVHGIRRSHRYHGGLAAVTSSFLVFSQFIKVFTAGLVTPGAVSM
jgi:hypothetical protein